MKKMATITTWFNRTFVELNEHLRWSFLPPLMVYFAAGISGLTGIVGTFFVKEYLGLSAVFLTGLAFWATLPWTLKMPLGHLVDLIWRWKAVLVYIGAGLIAASLTIMYWLITERDVMTAILPINTWFVISALLAPCGYVLQDAVADAMSVEAVPSHDDTGAPLNEDVSKALHTTMQTLGRAALFIGLISVALVNIFMFSGVEEKTEAEKAVIYGRIYLIALLIPLISVSGVLLAGWQKRRRRHAVPIEDKSSLTETKPDFWYFGGGLAFALLAITVGSSNLSFSKEIIFVSSLIIVLALMGQLAKRLDAANARTLFGTAAIIFVFRAIPGPGPGMSWFEIDILGFDQQFLSILTLITAILTLAGMIILRPLMATRSIAFIVLVLTAAGAVLSLPNIGLYYGVHSWTSAMTGGVVDARFIAILDTALESPLGQISMIPMLAWIARNAPSDLKATFFAVMASFTNLALSASNLLTSYMNRIFEVTREVKNRQTGEIEIAADYSELGMLLVSVVIIGVAVPVLTVVLVQRSRFQTNE